MIKEEIKKTIEKAVSTLELEVTSFIVEHPDDIAHGDYSTNIALVLAKSEKENPRAIAEKISNEINANLPNEIERIEVAGAGFINFYLSKEFFTKSVSEILKAGENFGKNDRLKGLKMLYEYTDPNPFKQFHIGHLMSNTIGESLSRLAEWSGADVKRMCYGGDVGLHIGKTIWGMIKNKSAFPEDSDSLEDKVKFLGDSYVFGTNQYEDDLVAKKEIENINKKVFEYKAGVATDEDIEVSYKKGKEWSLALFHKMYQRLSTDFDYEVFESEVSYEGQKIVENNILNGVFEKSEGAVVFNGEKEGRKAGLHTRVFINSQGLPTYEAKELGLVFKKFVLSDWDESVVITANEQKDYYQVFLGALSEIDLEKTNKTKHFSHGMLRLTSGKMSSRRGNVVLAEDFLEEIKTEVMEKMKDSKKIEEHNETLKNDIAEKVAIGAIKYVILRQSTGKDVIYDSKSALSFEGDSGPYLQYSIARAKSVLRKAKEKDLKPIPSILRTHLSIEEVTVLEKMLYRFPEVVARAGEEYAPQLVTTYLIELASAFNSWYGTNVIVSDEIEAPYRVALTTAFVLVMQNGLQILAIPVPERM